MNQREFHIQNEKEWVGIQKRIFPELSPSRAVWDTYYEIESALAHLSRPNLLHCYLPRGGGLDLESAKESYENGLLELNMNGLTYLVKPKELHFERFPEMENMSYLRMIVGEIKPTGKSEAVSEDIEEVTELYPLEYEDYTSWQSNCTESGEDLPKSARRVSRILKGDLCFFSKSSIYNQLPATYDGRHSTMSPLDFRRYIRDFIKMVIDIKKQRAK